MHKKTASNIASDIIDLHSRLEGFIKEGYKITDIIDSMENE